MTIYFVRTMSPNPHRPNTGAFAGKPHIEFLALPTHDPKAQKLVEDGFLVVTRDQYQAAVAAHAAFETDLKIPTPEYKANQNRNRS